MSVGWETDDQGYVLRVIFYVEDTNTALSIEQAINDISKGDTCPVNLFCKVKSIRVIVDEVEELSASNHQQESLKMIIMMIIAAIIMTSSL